jgi:hypothetical protein
MLGKEGVVAVTCLALEAGIARGPGVSVICNQVRGYGRRFGQRSRARFGIISFGIAGGLAPGLAAGDWVVASGVRSGNDVITTDRAWAQRLLEIYQTPCTHVVGADAVVQGPAEKYQLYDETGSAAVDMESLSPRRSPPSIAFRSPPAGLSSMPRTGRFPAATLGLRPDGSPDVVGVPARSGKTQVSFLVSFVQRSICRSPGGLAVRSQAAGHWAGLSLLQQRRL